MVTSVVLGAGLAAACAGGAPAPATLEVGRDSCAHCRMMVSTQRFAAQIVARGEEPAFFDDLGCLVASLRQQPDLPGDAVAFVADHRTNEWVRAADAVYTRASDLATPMNSHLVAHATNASRDEDPDARGGAPVTIAELFGASGPPGGST